MRFTDPKVQAELVQYRHRLAQDEALMASLGPAGYARRDEFLLPVGEEVGWLLHALIIARAPKRILELGTSYGYSTLFLADAARMVGAEVVTMELADYKQSYSREALSRAGLADLVDWRCGDALALLAAEAEAGGSQWDFVLLDIWKDLYVPCFEAVYPQLSEEAVLCSDNMIEPQVARPDARALRAAISAKGDMQTVLLPVGQGVELSVRWSAGSEKL